MKSILSNFDTTMSFWDANPTVNTIPEFAKLKKKEGVKKSSTIMWAISFLLDQNEDNIWKNVHGDECKELIKDEYLNDPKFKFEDYDEQIKAYERHLMSPAERSLLNFKNKLEERDAFIKDAPYTMETAKDLDAIQANTMKIFEIYKKIKEDLEKELSEGRVLGNKQESASERGLI